MTKLYRYTRSGGHVTWEGHVTSSTSCMYTGSLLSLHNPVARAARALAGRYTGEASSGDRARNTFFLLDQAQILSYQVQRTCQPACQSTRCWFIRFSHIRDVIRCVEKQRCCFHFRICTRCTRKAKGSATINHLCNMRRCL